jgi:hypothetical protein
MVPNWTSWKFDNGPTLAFDRDPPGLSYACPVFEDEAWRATLTFGVPSGVAWEGYLGYGVTARVSASVLPRGIQFAIYDQLIEAICLSCGLDVLSGTCDFGWALGF